jgi:hypothetical protein
MKVLKEGTALSKLIAWQLRYIANLDVIVIVIVIVSSVPRIKLS